MESGGETGDEEAVWVVRSRELEYECCEFKASVDSPAHNCGHSTDWCTQKWSLFKKIRTLADAQ